MNPQTDILKNKNTVEGNKNTTLQGSENQAILGNRNIVCYGSNNNIQLCPSNSENLPRQQPKKKIPDLLPYLVNRSQQEYELEKALKNFIQKASISPVICIVHGDEFQSHDKFLERLHEVSLPKLLAQESIKTHHLPSPPKLNSLPDFSDYLRHQLAYIVVGHSSATLEDINDHFNKSLQPILIHTHFLSEQLQRQELNVLENLLHFWQKWPVEINQNLMICIFIKYKITRKKQVKKSDKISLFFRLVKYFLQRHRYERINQKIYQYIKKLSLSNFGQFNRLSIIVLPELTGVYRGDVEDWVRMEYTQNVIGAAMADKFLREIRGVFDKWEEEYSSDTMPMEDLATDLIKLLESHVSGEERAT